MFRNFKVTEFADQDKQVINLKEIIRREVKYIRKFDLRRSIIQCGKFKNHCRCIYKI